MRKDSTPVLVNFETLTQKQQHVEANLYKYLFFLFVIGLMNNLGYVVVGSSAQNLADHFSEGKFMASFQFALTRFVNSKYLINIMHKKKIFVMLCNSSISFAILASCNTTKEKWGFYLALFGSTLMGTCSSLGESTMLAFPSELVTGWSSGTGFAGVFGAGFYLIMKSANVFIVLIPLVFLSYWFSFTWISSKRNKYKSIMSNIEPHTDDLPHENHLIDEVLEDNVVLVQYNDYNEARVNKNFNINSMKIVMKKIFYYSLNLGLVYFLEYVCITCYIDRANPKNNSPNFFKKNAYVILALTYQIGVLISRSSLYLIKIKQIWILTLIQLINFIIWLIEAKYKFIGIYIQIILILWVGLMGGASYVNVTYLILNDEKILRSEKELSMNVCTIFNDLGILFASIFSLILSNTFLK